MDNSRPRHLALHLIKQPLPAVVSILHRISGLLLFFALPLLLLMLQSSLESNESYGRLHDTLAHPLARLMVLAVSWAFLHHFCAGLRFLAIDLHYVRTLAQARFSGRMALAVSLALTASIGVKLW